MPEQNELVVLRRFAGLLPIDRSENHVVAVASKIASFALKSAPFKI
jgi:hypothetical protein